MCHARLIRPPWLRRVSARKPVPGPPPDRAWGVVAISTPLVSRCPRCLNCAPRPRRWGCQRVAAGSSRSAAHGTRVCHRLVLCQCSWSPRLAQHVPERLRAAGRGWRPVPQACPEALVRLLPAGCQQGARPVTWRGVGAASSGRHNPAGASPTGLWHNSV